MKLIKLNAIDSTNEYIKLNKSFFSQNSLVVYSFNQTNGKGQRGKIWTSQPYKNICISFYNKIEKTSNETLLKTNLFASLSVLEILKLYDIPKLKIKWPNDIMSGNKKIAGILIENSFFRNKIVDSIIGIGLNVNQIDFDLITDATSMKILKNESFDLNKLSDEFIKKFYLLEFQIKNLSKVGLLKKFTSNLYGLRKKQKFQIDNKVVEGFILRD
ncbi:MAG: biotin--[acetyl-CoA-carboxylase] ligase [Flavobacteriaceae bacterium]